MLGLSYISRRYEWRSPFLWTKSSSAISIKRNDASQVASRPFTSVKLGISKHYKDCHEDKGTWTNFDAIQGIPHHEDHLGRRNGCREFRLNVSSRVRSTNRHTDCIFTITQDIAGAEEPCGPHNTHTTEHQITTQEQETVRSRPECATTYAKSNVQTTNDQIRLHAHRKSCPVAHFWGILAIFEVPLLDIYVIVSLNYEYQRIAHPDLVFDDYWYCSHCEMLW